MSYAPIWEREMIRGYASTSTFVEYRTSTNAYLADINTVNSLDLAAQSANQQSEVIAKPMPMQGVRRIDLGAVAQIKSAPAVEIKIEL